MKKIILIIFATGIILFLGAYLYVNNLKKSGLHDYSENIKIEGLKEDVTVYRDKYGVPHIYAKKI